MNRNEKILHLIIQALKEELEYYSTEEDYSQWIMAAVLKKKLITKTMEKGKEIYVVRTVLKTSESPYVDGADIQVIVDLVKQEAFVEEESLEEGPIFHGGGEEDSLRWLENIGKIQYLQKENPFTIVTTKKGGEEHVE